MLRIDPSHGCAEIVDICYHVGRWEFELLPLLEAVTLMDFGTAQPPAAEYSAMTLIVRMSAVLRRLRERTLYLSDEAWKSSDDPAVCMLRFLHAGGLVERHGDTFAIDATETGRALTERAFPFDIIVQPADDSPAVSARERYREAWSLLLLGGDANTDEEGAPAVYGYDVPIIHLLVCGARTNGGTTLHKTWDTPIDSEATAVFLLVGSVSCACGRVSDLSVNRQVLDFDFRNMGLEYSSPAPKRRLTSSTDGDDSDGA